MNQELKEFLNTESIQPPRALSDRIVSKVYHELNPGLIQVFAKLFLVHAATALFTLSVCPQLGFRLLGDGMGLMHYFMSLGEHGCMAACGFFFLSVSLLVAALVMRPEEVRVIRKHR